MLYTIQNREELIKVQDRKYARIRVTFRNLTELDDIKDWCRENCDNNVFINADDTNITASYFYFESQQDALLYKLVH